MKEVIQCCKQIIINFFIQRSTLSSDITGILTNLTSAAYFKEKPLWLSVCVISIHILNE